MDDFLSDNLRPSDQERIPFASLADRSSSSAAPSSPGRTREFWWVNQSPASWSNEKAAGILKAAKTSRDGSKGHWSWITVGEVEPGDIIFHWSAQALRAMSVATSAPREVDLPADDPTFSAESGRTLYVVDVQYHELAVPINSSDIPNQLKQLPQSPFSTVGSPKEGYLIRTSDTFAFALINEFRDRLPREIVGGLEASDVAAWDGFCSWAAKFAGTEGILEGERSYKIAIGEKLDLVRDSLGTDGWPDLMKKALAPPNNLINYRSANTFRRWCIEEPVAAAAALRQAWRDESDTASRIGGFLESLRKDHHKGMGVDLALASMLQLAIDPPDLPPFRAVPYEKATSLSRWNRSKSVGSSSALYSEFLSFLDRFMTEAKARSLVIRDHLDAQALMWYIATGPAPDEWTEEDRLALEAYRLGGPPPRPAESTTLSKLADELLINVGSLRTVEKLLLDKRQVIFYGPPGTGKTFVARALARHFSQHGDSVRVQFHPSYSYEDFVEGYRPQIVDGQAGFHLAEGPLKNLASKAREDTLGTYVLLIDEINRGNVAKIFGELYFLLEYRDEQLHLQYSDAPFSLPKNLWVIGTMNTADRSIALVDAALRRRFHFVPFFPDQPPIQGLLRRWLVLNAPEMIWVADVVDRANDLLDDRHTAIGPSHFMRLPLNEEWVELIWDYSVKPFLEEQFFGNDDKLALFDLAKLKVGQPLSSGDVEGAAPNGQTSVSETASLDVDGSDPSPGA